MKCTSILFVLACVPAALGAEMLHKADFQAESGAPKMQTNIALLGSKSKLNELGEQMNLAIVDPSGALEDAANNNSDGDIQEDPSDPFITSKTGKLRPNLIENGDEWANEELVVDSRRQSGSDQPLSRKKRCNNDDDDGNARRSRRTRRNRARNAKRTRARAAKRARTSTSSTTVVRKVIQNGQVVSQTTETRGAATPVVAQPGRVIVQNQPAASVLTQPGQVVVQQQPAAPVVQAAQPVAVAQPAAAVSNPAMPSIAVTGSVKVN